MNENNIETKELNVQEKETISMDTTELSEQQMDEVAGGGLSSKVKNHFCRENLGPRFKEKSTFGWNWCASCKICGKVKVLERGPWSGDPD